MSDSPRFLASKSDVPPSAVILGAPIDLTESYRSGARFAPSRIRQVSDSIESYSPELDADLEEVNLVDGGDIPIDGKDLASGLLEIEASVWRASAEALTILLGGEHTVSLGAIKALARRHSGLRVLRLDAHLDFIDSFQGLRVSHATVFRRVAEVIGSRSLIQLGVRSGTKEEYAFAKTCLFSSSSLVLPPAVRSDLESTPLYLSLDIDVLDPAYAPGTGNPEPGGFSSRELVDFLYGLRGLNIVGVDVVEVSPPFDHSDITSVAAAKLVRELILLFGRSVHQSGR